MSHKVLSDTDPQPAEQLAVTLITAARILNVGTTTIAELVNDGRLPMVRLGRQRVIPMDALRALIRHRQDVA